jgi:transcriptional regulator with XRE-family HTH domain
VSTARSAPFGALLRRYREAAGLSQEDLAERAGLTAKEIGALERGERQRPQPHTLQQLAAALRLSDQQRAAFIAAVPRRADDVHESELRPLYRGESTAANQTTRGLFRFRYAGMAAYTQRLASQSGSLGSAGERQSQPIAGDR